MLRAKDRKENQPDVLAGPSRAAKGTRKSPESAGLLFALSDPEKGGTLVLGLKYRILRRREPGR
jgi:hypothetical protein